MTLFFYQQNCWDSRFVQERWVCKSDQGDQKGMGCVVVWKEAHGQEKNTSYWKLLLWQKGVKLCTACWGNTKITNGDAGGVRYPACTLNSDGMIWGAKGALAPPGMSLGMKTTRHQLFWPRQKIAQIFSFNTEALGQRNWWKTAIFPMLYSWAPTAR